MSRKEESKANYLPIIKEEFNDNDHNSIINIAESNSDTDCNNQQIEKLSNNAYSFLPASNIRSIRQGKDTKRKVKVQNYLD